ncbi:hypothetical protein [Paenibacillus tyrfis]|uniref:Uncharacterized protein n=1 Tax=Paenibacillus tyrfis TaxID=1501230 RepID=A0A081P368_9BACL|nr:hypothetical protein [Paenibacillus tyrfis]KEQ25141.1 hypothetical protein ET33_05490 [Paenibacillus tyrfis]
MSLYETSLSQETIRRTKSYDIGNLFYVAFFGGVIALTVLANRTGRWLHVNPNVLRGFILVAALLYLGKMGFYYAYFHHMIGLERVYVKYIARAAELLLFGGYYLALRQPYRQHMLTVGESEPLKKSGIVWCLISAGIEAVSIVLLIAL